MSVAARGVPLLTPGARPKQSPFIFLGAGLFDLGEPMSQLISRAERAL